MLRQPSAVALPLLFASLALACGEPEVVTVPARPAQVDRFEQRKASAIDILFVIDNSASMAANQRNLADNFEHFFRLIDPDPRRVGEPGEVDYRLAVATTDVVFTPGALVYGKGEPPILRPSTAYDPLEIFRERVVVGTQGASREEGFRAAELALETASELRDETNAPLFLRDVAYLYVIFVSDEDDESRDEVRYFERRFRSARGKGDERTVIVSAIAGPTTDPLPEECFDEKGNELVRDPGHRYKELVERTGGTFGNICAEDWAATLEQLAYTGLGLRKRFQLSAPVRYVENDDGSPILSVMFESIEVQYPCSTPEDDPRFTACTRVVDRCGGENGTRVCVPVYDMSHRNGFWFEPRDNTLVFAGNGIPGPGSVLVVRYLPRDSAGEGER